LFENPAESMGVHTILLVGKVPNYFREIRIWQKLLKEWN